MQALIRSRQSAYAYGHRVTLWATLCPDYAVEDYEIYAEIPGTPPAWYGGVENAWLPARNTLRLTEVRPNVRLLDLPARSLPVGWYSVTLYASNTAVTNCRFFIGGPSQHSYETVADILGGQVDTMRAGIAAEYLDPDVRLDNTNSIEGTWADVRARINDAWPGLPAGVCYQADNLYRLPSLRFTRLMAAVSGICQRRFVSESHDCDDFTFAKAGWLHHPNLSHGAWGLVWGRYDTGGGAHAMVGVATHDGGMQLIEPQTGKVVMPEAKHTLDKRWRPWLIVI
jgi:hypothetical protein